MKKRKREPRTGHNAATRMTNWKPRFLAALLQKGVLVQAAEAAGVSRNTVLKHRKQDPEFDAGVQDAIDGFVDSLEAEAIRRGRDGVDEPVYYEGKQIATIKKYSDGLLILLLRAHLPAKYGQATKLQHTGPGGGPIQTQNVSDLSRLTDAELQALQAIHAKLAGEPADDVDAGEPAPE